MTSRLSAPLENVSAIRSFVRNPRCAAAEYMSSKAHRHAETRQRGTAGDGDLRKKNGEIAMKNIFQIAALVIALGAGVATAQAMGSAQTTGDIMTKAYTGR